MFVYTQQAIDPRTRMVLFKMLNRGVFHDINGCISTGKEVRFHYFCCYIYYSFNDSIMKIVTSKFSLIPF